MIPREIRRETLPAIPAVAAAAALSAAANAEAAKRRNFLIIVADDLGFSDIGVRLAHGGIAHTALCSTTP